MGDRISVKTPLAKGGQASSRTEGALLSPHPGARLSAVRAAGPPGAPGGARGLPGTSGSDGACRGFPSVDGLGKAPQGPSGQPAEACGGPISPLWPNSAPSEAEVPEGKERDTCKSPEEEVWDGNVGLAASGDLPLVFPAFEPLVGLPLVPESSCPSPGPKKGGRTRGPPACSRWDEPPVGKQHPGASPAPAPGSLRPSGSQTSLDASGSSEPDRGDGVLGSPPAGSGPPAPAQEPRRERAPLPFSPSQVSGPPPQWNPQEPPAESPPDRLRSAPGVSPASPSDKETELSESWTRMADAF